jgi:hypothetical protein
MDDDFCHPILTIIFLITIVGGLVLLLVKAYS